MALLIYILLLLAYWEWARIGPIPASQPKSALTLLSGWRDESTPGSNMRRVFSRMTLLLVAYLSLEAMVPTDSLAPKGLGVWAAAIWSFSFFCFAVVVIPFLTSKRFRPNPVRLALDTGTSIAISILGFSLIYRAYGLDADCITTHGKAVYIYFSAVTFSTLGYGDYAPCGQIQLVAAFQAILGNLHLGLIVGTAFLAVQANDASADEDAADKHDQKNAADHGN
ncbi:MAG: ion channel [Paracoccaceae bacterium]